MATKQQGQGGALDSLKGRRATKARPEPLWKGPCDEGITFSLLSRYLVCRERFRLLTIEGLAPAEDFNHKIEYGNMWHVCEESSAMGVDYRAPLVAYCKSLAARHKLAGDQIEKWYQICIRQFPVYLNYWREHPDVVEREHVGAETSFKVPVQLPSGRVAYLRGKIDSTDYVKSNPLPSHVGIWGQENKTKGDIDEVAVRDQLKFDLQTMIYMTALDTMNRYSDFGHEPTDALAEALAGRPVAGIRYNVVRRPLSGGKGTIVQHKPSKSNPAGETPAAFYDRLAQYFRDEPAFFFMRWHLPVSADDLARFQRLCLTPLLENLCDDYEWWETCKRKGGDVYDVDERQRVFSDHMPRQYVFPYGVWNVLTEGGKGDIDGYLFDGSEVGLERSANLFPELNA